MLLKRKISPTSSLFEAGSKESSIMDEFLSTTELMKYTFWTQLTREQRYTVYRFMSLRETSPHRIQSISTRTKADIFIVIAGSGILKDSKDPTEKYPLKIGSVFGATEQFESFHRLSSSEIETKDERKEHAPSSIEPRTCVGVLPTGALIRLRLLDFQMALLGPDIDLEQEFLAKLSPAEKLIYEARKMASKSLSPILFDVLESHDLVPSSPEDLSFVNLCNGVYMRKIEIHKGEPPTVVIVLSGTIDIILKQHRSIVLSLNDEKGDSSTVSVKVRFYINKLHSFIGFSFLIFAVTF